MFERKKKMKIFLIINKINISQIKKKKTDKLFKKLKFIFDSVEQQFVLKLLGTMVQISTV